MNPRVNLPTAAISDFCRTYSIRELSIFGSALRDDFGDDSDIDILIDPAPSSRIGLVRLQRMRDELEELLGRRVDLLTKNGLNRHIRDAILREAEVIHAE